MNVPLLLARLLAWLTRQRIALANTLAVMYPDGVKTYLSDAAIATRYFCLKAGTDADHAAASAADTDCPVGIVLETASAAEKQISVALLGAYKGTLIGIANATITVGDMVVSAGNGKLKTLPTTTWTGYIIGRALATVAAGAEVPFIPCFPTQRVVA